MNEAKVARDRHALNRQTGACPTESAAVTPPRSTYTFDLHHHVEDDFARMVSPGCSRRFGARLVARPLT